VRRFATALGVVLFFTTIGTAGKNLADYPLQVSIIEAHWHNHRDGTVNGWGQGDIRDADSIHGFDFAYDAGTPFHRTLGDAHYIGKWKKQSLKLEILVGEIGSVDKFISYELKTTVREDVYVRAPDGALAISQEEYKKQQQ